MQISLPNWTFNQYAAAGKHVMSYAAGAVSFAVAFHFLSSTDASSINDNIGHVYNGLMEAAKGVLGLVATGTSIYAGLKAAKNASPISQAASLEKTIPGTKVITDPKIADAIPSPNVMSNVNVKVVPK